jgi:hypothetical protein
MQGVRPTMSSSSLIQLGRWHGAMMDQFDETRPLAEGFRPSLAALEAADKAVEGALDGLLFPRVRLAVTEVVVDTGLRRLHAVAKGEDGGKEGPLVATLFPAGLSPVVQPVGVRQVAAVDALLQRAEARKLGEHPVLGPRLVALKAERDRLAAALQERDSARAALSMVRANELAAREDFVAAYSKDAGLLRALFPTDRQRQELFFDQWRATPSVSEVEDGAGDAGAGGVVEPG